MGGHELRRLNATGGVTLRLFLVELDGDNIEQAEQPPCEIIPGQVSSL
jgi:hypothetical protein